MTGIKGIQGKMSFFNTISQDGEELKKSLLQANRQSERVYIIMKFKGIPMTPFEVLDEYCKFFPECPVTSIRRAMTNLSGINPPQLIKTTEMKKEKYGQPNYKWMVI